MAALFQMQIFLFDILNQCRDAMNILDCDHCHKISPALQQQ